MVPSKLLFFLVLLQAGHELSRPSAAVYASPSSLESCPASSEAIATRTEWSRRAAHDGYNFIESETRPRR